MQSFKTANKLLKYSLILSAETVIIGTPRSPRNIIDTYL